MIAKLWKMKIDELMGQADSISKLNHHRAKVLEELKQAVLDYLSECDNPVPDYAYRRVLRNRLRELTGAPPEPRS